jgi:tetrahydromethanopterin S-methyltransferase subunit G
MKTELTQNEIKTLKETAKKLNDHDELKNQIKEEARLREEADDEIKNNYIKRFDKLDKKVESVDNKIERLDAKIDTKIGKVNGRLFSFLITIVSSILISTIIIFITQVWDKIFK